MTGFSGRRNRDRGGSAQKPVYLFSADSIFSGELTGAYFLLNGTASTVQSGSTMLLSPSGPISRTSVTLGNYQVPWIPFDGTSNLFSTPTNAPSPASSFSCIALIYCADTTASHCIVGRDDGTHRLLNWNIQAGTASLGNNNVDFIKLNGNFDTAAGFHDVSKNAWHFVAMTYKSITDGTSEIRVYTDGVETANLTTAHSPPADGTGAPLCVGARNPTYNPDFFVGRIAMAGYTEKVISSSTISNMNTQISNLLAGTL